MNDNFNGDNDYEDLIALPRPQSKFYPPMSREKRAAQFSPFAALSGHEEAIREKARLTERKIELSDTEKAQLNRRLLLLQEHLEQKPIITITYFVPDGQKSGGHYLTETGAITKIVEYDRTITFRDQVIPIRNIFSLEGELFDKIVDGNLWGKQLP